MNLHRTLVEFVDELKHRGAIEQDCDVTPVVRSFTTTKETALQAVRIFDILEQVYEKYANTVFCFSAKRRTPKERNCAKMRFVIAAGQELGLSNRFLCEVLKKDRSTGSYHKQAHNDICGAYSDYADVYTQYLMEVKELIEQAKNKQDEEV